MKKVILSISAMLLVGAAAIAQNNSVVAQSGDTNTALVGQNGDGNNSAIGTVGDENKSSVYQGILPGQYSAQDNTAIVKQEGDLNTTFISQSNKNNLASQTQTGDSNEAVIWQDQIADPNNTGGPLGGGDKAWQTQTGNNNFATIDQGTTGNELPKPTPLGAFEGWQIAALNADTAVQIPFDPNGGNEATQVQTGDYNGAYASQGGTGNISYQEQTSPDGTTLADGNVSRHFQYGEGNHASTWQDGIRNTENTLQIGSGNISTVKQDNSAGILANRHLGFSHGDGNVIIVNQTGNGATP